MIFFLMIPLPPRSTLTDTLLPITTLFRSPEPSCVFRLLLFHPSGNGFQPVFPPRLKHRDRPELGAPVPRSGEMLFPQPADGRGVEQAVGFHSGRIQEMLRPVPQRAAQPFGDGNGEALLRPVAKLDRKSTRLNSSH